MPEQNYAERLALDTVIYPVIGSSKAAMIHSNYEVSLDDGSRRFIDFAIIGASVRIAIEIDGYNYHAEGAIGRDAFDDQLSRQNELILLGWKILRFSFDQINTIPEVCQNQLRRLIISDSDLHPNFSITLEPSELQKEALVALNKTRELGKNKGLVCLPTGTGKTILSALDAKNFEGRILFVVHNNHILKQAAAAYKRVFPNKTVGFINSEENQKADKEDMVFANVSSLRDQATLSNFAVDDFTYLVLDEFHHGAANSYKNLLSYFKPKFTLGLTATPERTDGKSILQLLQNNLIYSISLSKAIERGFLVPFSYYGLFDNIDYSNIEHNGFRYDINDLEKALFIPRRNDAIFKVFQEHASDKPAIAFCVSIEHAEKMSEFFQVKGVSCVAIHSQLSKTDKAHRISQYERGEVQVVFVRDIFNEGVDFPDTQAVLFLRPTESKIIFLQQLGRGLRLAANKANIVVLDFIGNYFGSSEIPSLVRKMAGGFENSGEFSKPEYIFDNGCEVHFSKEVIEHLQVADFNALPKDKIISKIISIYDKKNGTLNPLDLYIGLKEEFGISIKSFGGYARLVDRMNTLLDDTIVMDSQFANFQPEKTVESDDYLFFISNIGNAIAKNLFVVVDEVYYGYKPDFLFVERLKVIRDNLFSLFAPLSSLCLIKNTVNSYASEVEFVNESISNKKKSFEDLFFKQLSEVSFARNSSAITNALKNELPKIANLVMQANVINDSYSYINFSSEILQISHLTWIRDFYEMTDPDRLDLTQGDRAYLANRAQIMWKESPIS